MVKSKYLLLVLCVWLHRVDCVLVLQLDLSDNQISDGLELLCASPNLEFLNLSSNPLKDISSLEALVSTYYLSPVSTTRVDGPS